MKGMERARGNGRQERPALTAIQSKLDERFQRETKALYRARLLHTGMLVACLFVALALLDGVAVATWAPGAPLGVLLGLRFGTAAFLIVGVLLFRARSSVPPLVVDALLFLPAAFSVLFSMSKQKS